MVIILKLNQNKNHGLGVLFPVEKSFHVFNLACMLRDHFSNLCGRINQNVNKERLVLVLPYGGGGGGGGRGRGGGFNILGQSIIRAVKKALALPLKRH